MPIKTTYEIYNSHHLAPQYSTSDKALAYAEYMALIRKGGDVYRLVQTPMADGALTKAEEYLILVYRVRKLMRQYFDRGRRKEDLMASLEHEKKLDDWNRRTQEYIDSHPGYKPADPKSHSFYVLVSSWRNTWRERKKYSKRKTGFDEAVMREMTKKCRDIEKKIDEYIKDKMQLI